jgi:chromosome segregation ATPase
MRLLTKTEVRKYTNLQNSETRRMRTDVHREIAEKNRELSLLRDELAKEKAELEAKRDEQRSTINSEIAQFEKKRDEVLSEIKTYERSLAYLTDVQRRKEIDEKEQAIGLARKKLGEDEKALEIRREVLSERIHDLTEKVSILREAEKALDRREQGLRAEEKTSLLALENIAASHASIKREYVILNEQKRQLALTDQRLTCLADVLETNRKDFEKHKKDKEYEFEMERIGIKDGYAQLEKSRNEILGTIQ